MSNEVDLYGGGELQPYSPSQPLAPAPDVLTNREIYEYQRSPRGGQMVFGQPLPPGVSLSQIMQGYKQLGDVFSLDFMKLGYSISQTQKCVSWFMNAITDPPGKEQKRHSYELFEHRSDPLFQAFANYASDHGFSAKLVSDICWWVSEAGKKLNAQAQQVAVSQARMAPNSSEAMLSQLSEADFNRVLKINEQAQINSLATLAAKHGQYTAQNMVALAQAHLEKLTPRERQHFDQFTTVNGVNWIHCLNCAETIEFLYNASIGSASLPTSGAAISAELKEIEALLATPVGRRAYFKDPQLQARYRTLLDMRD